MQWSELSRHHCVFTVAFTNGVTKTLSSAQVTCLCIYPSQIQGMPSFVFHRKIVLTAALISSVFIDVLWYWLETLDVIQGTCQHVWLFTKGYWERLMIEHQIIGYPGFISKPSVKAESPILSCFFRIYIGLGAKTINCASSVVVENFGGIFCCQKQLVILYLFSQTFTLETHPPPAPSPPTPVSPR